MTIASLISIGNTYVLVLYFTIKVFFIQNNATKRETPKTSRRTLVRLKWKTAVCHNPNHIGSYQTTLLMSINADQTRLETAFKIENYCRLVTISIQYVQHQCRGIRTRTDVATWPRIAKYGASK